MKFLSSKESINNIETECIVLTIFQKQSTNIKLIDEILKLGDFKAKIGQTLLLYPNKNDNFKAKKILLLGCGTKKDLNERTFKEILLSLTAFLKSSNIKKIAIDEVDFTNKTKEWIYKFSTLIIKNSRYVVNKIFKKESESNKNTLKEVIFKSNINIDKFIKQGEAIADGMALARNLSDLPANICTPSYLASAAEKLAKKHKINCEILSEDKMQELGMNTLLTVAKGSTEPAKLIAMEYMKGGEEKPIVLVGKGVTFDSGGISLKPGSSMDEMKFDMCGAASLFGVIEAIASLNIAINLIVLIPAVENMPSHRSAKPGDVVKSLSGKTIEILNTDAEGRLILCDTLSYCKKYNPKIVIDVATLTGAVIIALGKNLTGLIANNQNLADDLLEAGNEVLDFAWQLPLVEEYNELLNSNFADLANIASSSGAGTITAACFLAQFTKKYKWAHLDIAGTAWTGGGAKGATGRPVPLLVQYILNQIN